MAFPELGLKETYDSDEDDILEDFYVPVLSHAVRYDRLAGFFSSGSLAAAAKGMAKFLQNGGQMRLVTSVQLSREDHDAIKNGLANPDEVISSMMRKELELADSLQQSCVEGLAWMIAEGKLEVKVAVPYGPHGYDAGALGTNSIYHQKVGILHDGEKNIVTFSGSINETGTAWNSNIEEFKVFCSWKPGQDAYGSRDAMKFEKFWHGHASNTKVFDLPSAIRDDLIRMAPKEKEAAIDRLRGSLSPLALRGYQRDAKAEWLKNNRRGIFEMATGTGKTHAAISCIKEVCDSSKGNLVVVACPYIHLVTQWTSALKEWGIDSQVCYESTAKWRDDVGKRVNYLGSGVMDNMVIVTTHRTFSSSTFREMVGDHEQMSLLIADEVHKIGSEGYSGGLLEGYDMRLGLSATPERYHDQTGTDKIMSYFGGTVYKYGLDRAIKDGYLVRYSLYPHVVHMTFDESNRHNDLSKRIAIEMSKRPPDTPDLAKVESLSREQSNIVKAAENKIPVLREILQKNQDLDHCLVYCSSLKQLGAAADVLHSMGVIFHRFTSKESDDDRRKLLGEFDSGTKSVLLAIKCLDEGVDVPSTRSAIILASSGNPIEFIQRMGRILRLHDGKDRAVIHDLIVLPPESDMESTPTGTQKNMVRKELDRLGRFSQSSDNPEFSADLIKRLIKRYNL